jgi:methylenetetrahydrofolate dehydrogenase (NADP+)/methenyltetrahydrofolate cyclohydrolase
VTEAVRMDGSALARRIQGELADDVARLKRERGRAPTLAVVLVGEDPASQIYVRNKSRACAAAGLIGTTHHLETACSPQQLRALIERLNADPAVDGVLVQLPLPPQIDPVAVRTWVDPYKDVDGLHPENAGLLAQGAPRFVPCTPAGCLELLRAYEVPLQGRRAVIIGRSPIVGRPLSILLSAPGCDATVTLCHSRSRELAEVCAQGEILVAAAGVPLLVRAEHVREGAVVIDVGIHRLKGDNGSTAPERLAGDVHPEVAARASLLTPVPGGVGPMTIAMLLRNTVQACQLREDR